MTFWITNRLGTIAEGDPYEPGVIIVNVSNLIDGKGNNLRLIAEKIVIAHSILKDFGRFQRVVIQCRGGVSRSNTIAAAVLARHLHIDLDSAMAEVLAKVPRTQYNYDLVDSVKQVLVALGQSYNIPYSL